eukprot:comp19913_c0_seq1/m.24151 comp19913_c0_seq1/g.24151  ORF comp19913_c0_seq1/g.24151 comp19913_c0_seq1/m.24151 type:complete len:450 (-) comp19913_c0_seq1:490-1839(-)
MASCKSLGQTKGWAFQALALCGIVCAVRAVPVKLGATTKQFLVLSDFHLDPYYNTAQAYGSCKGNSQSYGAYTCDSPMALVDRTVQVAKIVLPDPTFIAVTGDYVRHYADYMPGKANDILSAVKNVTDAISRHYPEVVQNHGLENLLGNDDFEHNYYIGIQTGDPWAGPPNAYLTRMAQQIWNDTMLEPRITTFQRGGFYSHEVDDGLLLIALNTIPYSTKHSPDTRSNPDPFGQFSWLESTLSGARKNGTKVYVMGHIPPGLDSYALEPMWVETYAERYRKIIGDYSDVVLAQFFAHLHGDEFRTFPEGTAAFGSASPLFITSSVSPVYTNNPSFRTVTYDPATKKLTNYAVYAVDLSTLGTGHEQWLGEYKAVEYFGLSSLDNASFRNLAKSFLADDAAWDKFREVYKAMVPQPACMGKCRVQQVCVMLSFTQADFNHCVQMNGNIL